MAAHHAGRSAKAAAQHASAGNASRVVPRPDRQLKVPDGFEVELFAEGLEDPRMLRVAPNGDIFVAETGAGRIRVLRAADGATKPSEQRSSPAA